MKEKSNSFLILLQLKQFKKQLNSSITNKKSPKNLNSKKNINNINKSIQCPRKRKCNNKMKKK